MSTKVSRMVADRAAIGSTVLSAIAIHGPEVAPVIEKALFPEGAPPKLTVAGFIEALGAHLQRRGEALVNADKVHAAELADDDAPRAAREEGVSEIRGYLVSLRASLAGNYGPAVASAYGLDGALPDDAAALANLSGKVEHLLRNRALTEAPKRVSLKLDPLAAADDLKALADGLRKSLGDIEREKREAQLTLKAKNEAMAAWGPGYQGVADAVAALFVIGGRPDLADKVRPTARRRAGLPEAEDTATPPEAGGDEKAAPPVAAPGT